MDLRRLTLESANNDRLLSKVEKPSATHSVQFYESHSAFLDSLGEYAAAALRAGASVIVVLTEAHRLGLAERLENSAIDLELAAREDRYICLDAEETLSQFLVEGWPDKPQLFRVAEPVLQRAGLGARRGSGSVFVFGEMVALLWSQGRQDAALYLDKLWSELQKSHSFTLRCAYPMSCFADAAHEAKFCQVCELHDFVLPAESYASLHNDIDRMRMIGALQQKALALRAAIAERERHIERCAQLERRLRHAELVAAQLLEASHDCMKVLDLEGRLVYMSLLGRRLLEIEDFSQIAGKRWTDFWREEDRPRAIAAVAAAKAGEVGSFQGDLSTRSGTKKSWRVRVTPVLGFDGNVERLIAVSRDITDLERSQQIAVQAEKLAAAGRLAATIAHEINNPLEAVTNLIYLAKSAQGVPDEVCKQLEIADRELARVAQLAQQTLGFYRDNSSSKWVSVKELVDDVLLIYERKLRYKRIETAISVQPHLEVFGKQGELKQALSNLIANAIEASKIGGRIWLRARDASNWSNQEEAGVRITVADNGAGMPAEIRQRVFVPFFTTKPGIGTGIGLWVTRSLIEQHGGFMRFRSRQGTGTSMSFFVPDSQTVAERELHQRD